MKRIILLLIVLLLTLTAASALANSWNLTGPLLNYVSRTHAYDSYTAKVSVDQSKKGINTVAAFMVSRKHTLLLAGRKDDAGDWQVYECNYDVSNADADYKPELTCLNDQVTLTNAAGDTFVFQWLHDDEMGLTGFFLVRAERGSGFTVTMDECGHYFAEEDGQSIHWYTSQPITLSSFDLWHFPDSGSAIRTMNTVRCLCESWMMLDLPIDLKLNVKLPVYSAPDAASYRAANGKAAVSLKESYVPLACADDDWVLIDYALDTGRHRVGWVRDDRVQYIGGYIDSEGVPVTLRGMYCLTDDPYHSGSEVVSTAELTDVRLLCADCGVPWYSYVAAQWKGQVIWGFVPTAAIDPGEGRLSSMLLDLPTESNGHRFAVMTDIATFTEPVAKPLFEIESLTLDSNSRTTAVTGSFGAIIMDDCYAPFGFGAVQHTYPLAAGFVLMMPMDEDYLLDPFIPYTDIAEALIDWYRYEDPADALAYGLTSQIELNDAGEITYMEYFYVPWE